MCSQQIGLARSSLGIWVSEGCKKIFALNEEEEESSGSELVT